MNQAFETFFNNFVASIETQFANLSRQFPNILMAILIVTVGMMLSNLASRLARRAIGSRTEDQIMINFLSKATKLVLAGMFIMYALKVGGLQGIATGILTAAGASAVIIGFAFRDIGENFISGIILSFNRPFSVGDTVSIGDIFGKVKSVEFRYAKVRTFDGKDVYIPNSDVIKKPVYNFTEDGFIRFDFIVGIAYENDITSASDLITKILDTHTSIFRDETHHNFVCPTELATNTVNLRVHFWIRTYEYGREAFIIKGQIIAAVKEALVDGGFNLPANIVEMKMYEAQPFLPFRLEDRPKEIS